MLDFFSSRLSGGTTGAVPDPVIEQNYVPSLGIERERGIHICTDRHIYIYIHVYTCVYIYIYIYTYTFAYLCAYTHIIHIQCYETASTCMCIYTYMYRRYSIASSIQ